MVDLSIVLLGYGIGAALGALALHRTHNHYQREIRKLEAELAEQGPKSNTRIASLSLREVSAQRLWIETEKDVDERAALLRAAAWMTLRADELLTKQRSRRDAMPANVVRLGDK